MAKRRFNAHWVKVSLTGLGAVAAMGGAVALVKPPPLTPVAVLVHPVSALGSVPVSDITWVRMEHPPKGTITQWTGVPLAAHSLTAGTVLTASDFTTAAQAVGLKQGEVRYVVPITAASAVTTIGSRVDVWSLPSNGGSATAVPQELAVGVRVIGLYTSQGTPVGGTPSSGGLLGGSSNTPQAPAMAALAVPGGELPNFMQANPGQTALLVDDPSQSQFGLMMPSGSGSGSSSGSAGSPSHTGTTSTASATTTPSSTTPTTSTTATTSSTSTSKKP